MRAFSVFLVLCTSAMPSSAQRADSTRVSPRATARETADTSKIRPAIKPPISPGRSFAYSALLPGYSQTRLDRPLAGAIFMITESIAVAMLRESSAELREARRFRSDSLENIGNDPVTGTAVQQRSSFNDQLINIRKGHVEDWIAFLVGNHLFAGADAYVAAHLWDLKSEIAVIPTPSGAAVVARVRW